MDEGRVVVVLPRVLFYCRFYVCRPFRRGGGRGGSFGGGVGVGDIGSVTVLIADKNVFYTWGQNARILKKRFNLMSLRVLFE